MSDMPPLISLTTAMTDPEYFGGVFASPSYWTWLTAAKLVDGIPLTEPREIALFELCAGRPYNRAAHRAVRRLILLVGRRGGKDRFQSAVAIWKAALCLNWRKHVSAGEGAVVLLIGADKKQATILRRYCHGLLETPRLAAEVTRQTDWVIEFANGASVEIVANDANLVRGRSAIAVLGTEAAHWRTDDDSLSSDEEVVTGALPSMAMAPDCPGGLLVMGSSVHRKRGYMYRKYKELHGNNDTEEICWFAPSQVMNPLLTQATIDEALASDRVRMSAEFLNQWREDISDYIPAELLEACTDFGCYERPPQGYGFSYSAHVDIATGLGNSSAALSIAHRDYTKGLQVQDVIREVRPPFVPEVVVKEFAELAKRYGVTTVYADQFAYGLHASLWDGTRTGVRLAEAKHNTAENFLRLLPSLLAKKVRFLDSKVQRSQFSQLERHMMSGNETIRKPQTASARDDVATAAAGALVAVGDGTGYLGGVSGYALWSD
jgi:hypothetical protein